MFPPLPEMNPGETPVQIWHDPFFENSGLDIRVLRLDLIHPWIQGNKWFKLMPFAEKCIAENRSGFLSMGGPFSNHLIALSCAAFSMKKRSVFLVRGEEKEWENNPAITQMKEWGSEILPLSRTTFRQWHQQGPDDTLSPEFQNLIWVPMGGTPAGPAPGLTALSRVISAAAEFDFLVLPAATGGTAAGIARGMPADKKMLVTEVLKSGGGLEAAFRKDVPENGPETTWLSDYHFGGYARTNPVLNRFCRQINETQMFKIEPVYSGKCFFAVSDLARKGHFGIRNRILILHTGGIFPWNTGLEG